MTLFEKLKDEHVITLHQVWHEYPSTIDALFDELNGKYYWIELSYKSICMLKSELGLKDYSPVSISEIFTDHKTVNEIINKVKEQDEQ
jgi:hypothetical protein